MSKYFSEADIDGIISKLDLEEKVQLLSGAGRFALNGNERLGVPVIHVRAIQLVETTILIC